MPSVFTSPTTPYLLIPGCVLALVLGLALLNGYRRSREPVMLYAGAGLVVSAGVALWLGTYFALLPAFVVVLVLYLRAAGEPDPANGAAPASRAEGASFEVIFRVQAPEAHVRFGVAGAVHQARAQGYWEQRTVAPPGAPLVLHVAGPPTSPLAAELWCDGALLASDQRAAGPVTLQVHARPAA